MDPLSESSFNLNATPEEDQFSKIVGSNKSLSQYEERSCKNLLPQFIASAVAASGHVIVGISMSFSAILLPQLEAATSEISVTKSQTSWIASVFVLIAPVGALLSGYLMGRYGRLNTLKLATIPGVLGWVAIALAWNIPLMIVGRLLTGLASALATSPAVVFITEIARKDMRGSLLSLGPAFVSLGMVISYLKGWLMGWRMVAWLCNIYTVAPLILLLFIHESPAWLITKGRDDEAKKSLIWLYRYQPQLDNWDESFAELQLKLLKREHEQKQKKTTKKQSTLKEFLKPTGYKPLLILTGLFTFQQFSGIYIFLFYSVTFFEEVGTNINPYMASILIGVIRFIMSLVNTWMLKYYNRRILVMVSAAGMAVCTFISGLFTHWIKNKTTELNWVPVVFLLLYVVSSMMGLLSIPWTMTAELFPIEIRSMAHSIATSLVNIIMFVAVQNYFNMMEFLGSSAGVQWFFSAVCLGAVVYSFVFLPETHGKKLSDIEEYFHHNTIYLGQKKKEAKRAAIHLVFNSKENEEKLLKV